MIKFYKKNKIPEILRKYNIDFIKTEAKLELKSDQDFTSIPSNKIVKMLGLKQDKGHVIFIERLNQIEKNWLFIYFKYENYYDVYNTDGQIIKEGFYSLINEILDGLQ
jgi:hypothetical protein